MFIGVLSVLDGHKVQLLENLLYPCDEFLKCLKEPERTENMVVITTAPSGSLLTLTHDHLVYVDKGNKWEYMYSENVLPGMQIRVINGESDHVESVLSVDR